MSQLHRCRECTLLRVAQEGEVCEECQRNTPAAQSPAEPSVTITYTSSTSDTVYSSAWYDAVHGMIPG